MWAADQGVQIDDPLGSTYRPPQRTRTRAALILPIAAVMLLIGGFFFARSLWWSLRPTPDFRSLAQNPDTSLHGTIAFISPYPHDDCISIAAASGSAAKKVACLDGPAGDLTWLPDGRLQSIRYKGGRGTADTKGWVINVETGEVEDIPRADIPPEKNAPDIVLGPNGERVATESKRGRLTMTLTTDHATRTLLSVGAPHTYTFGQPAWNADGSWFVVKDDLDRLLLVTTAEPSQTRVLVRGGFAQAVHDADRFAIR